MKRFHRSLSTSMVLGLYLAHASCGADSPAASPAPGSATPREPITAEPLPESPRVLIIGLDGADPRDVRRLAEEGRVPNLARLMEGSVTAELATVANASPIIWTSVATGVLPPKHGIEFFRQGREPAASTMRKRPALWNVLSHYGHSVGILAWWATFPAETVEGYLVSPYAVLMPPRGTEARIGRLWDPGDPRKSHPPELQNRLADLVYTDADIDLEELAHIHADEERTTNTPWVLAKDRSYYEMALRLLAERPVETVAVYFQGIDAAGHDFERWVFGKNNNEARPPKVSDEEFEAAMERVWAMYEHVDEMVGHLVAGTRGTDVIVLSDHGWNYDGTGHWDGPPGIFIGNGPSFRAGAAPEDLIVTDVMPIVLAILGVPQSREFDGRVPPGLLREDLEAALQWVDDYPIPAVALADEIDNAAPENELMMERLESLGYVGEDDH